MIGYVFQDPTLMPWRTVRGNVELLAELHGFGRDERRRVGQRAIDLVGLSGFEHHYPKSLSGGMRMRCSLARTLTLQPPIMLFDEPFGAVDEITRERLNEETLRLFEAEQFAGLFITHSISEAVFLSTRVLVMSPRPGRIIAEVGDSVLVSRGSPSCASTPGSGRSAPRCPTPCGPAMSLPDPDRHDRGGAGRRRVAAGAQRPAADRRATDASPRSCRHSSCSDC